MAAPAKTSAKAAPRRQLSPQRRSMEGKVQVAKMELALDEDSYRDVMMRITKRASIKVCTDEEVIALINEFKRQGWQAKPKNPPRFANSRSRGADHPTARKARALWISLEQLGAIGNASEAALEAFVKRQMGAERLQWADQGQMDKVIEALTAIARRHGWEPKQPNVKAIKAALVAAILTKLKAKGYADEDWHIATAADRIAGFIHPQGFTQPTMWEPGDLDAVIRKFAHLLKTGRKDGML